MATRTRLTRAQKRSLAMMLLTQAGNLVEFWDEMVAGEPGMADVDPAEGAAQLARWLQHLPGESWDIRLPRPWAE